MTDRRFGAPRKFGTSTTFGASSSPVSGRLIWGIEIDWDGDGIFDGSNEAGYLISLQTSRGRQGYVSASGQGFEQVGIGTCHITLDNQSGRFDAWNTTSALYPNVTYGRDVRVTVRDVETGTIYPVFYGIIQDIDPHYNPSTGDAYVVLSCSDAWVYLRSYSANVAIQENITPGAAIGYILDDISFPTRWGRDLDAGTDTIRYFWSSGNKQAGSVIEDVANSFVGYFFISADGKATYRNRANIGSAVASYDQSDLLKDISLPQPWKNSRNVTRIKTHPRTAAAAGVVYQLVGDAPAISNGESLTLFGDYKYDNQSVPATGLISPVATTDYTMNTQADGGGTNKTANCTVTFTDFGDRCKLVVTNNSGGTVYVTKLQVRGEALYEPNVSDIVYPSTLPAEPRQFVLDLLWQQDVNVAADFSNVLGPFLAERHPFPVIQIDERPDIQFTPDLFEVVTLTSSKYGILGDSFRVAYISHETLHPNCQAVRTKMYLEPYIDGGDYWTWDTASDFNLTTIFGA